MIDLPAAIQNVVAAVEQLARVARQDDKTCLLNGIALNQDATDFGRNIEDPDILVFGDLNRFKQINDKFGHPAGDAALQHIGSLIDMLLVKACDAKAYRRSGDEFVLVLKASKLLIFKEQASKYFQNCILTFNQNQLSVSMSFGYARTSSEDADFQTLQDRAEQACLIAKSQGGGACVEWTKDLEQQAVKSLRSRCHACNTTISCDVPEASMPPSKQLSVCPVCQARLIADELTKDSSLEKGAAGLGDPATS